MKKLRCETCGADLKLDENKEYAKCEYCHTSYKMNEDVNVNIKLGDNIKDNFNENLKITNGIVKKFSFIPLIFFIVFLIIFISSFMSIKNSRKEFDTAYFNNSFEIYSGTKNVMMVGKLLDEVVINNKKNNRKITLVYNDKKITDANEIIEIKRGLESSQYEVIFDYDKNGYINMVTIK